MNRFILAIRCFFLVLFAWRLPREAVELLPPPELDPQVPPQQLPPATTKSDSAVAPVKVPPVPAVDEVALAERGAMRFLALLQREGRLVDFLEENIETYQDAQIGAAVRDIHRGCKKVLDEYIKLEPVRKESEEAMVRIEAGFDASAIRLVGEVVGQPPFHGTLRHPGWRAASLRLPELPDKYDPSVIAPAEVELGGG